MNNIDQLRDEVYQVFMEYAKGSALAVGALLGMASIPVLAYVFFAVVLTVFADTITWLFL